MRNQPTLLDDRSFALVPLVPRQLHRRYDVQVPLAKSVRQMNCIGRCSWCDATATAQGQGYKAHLQACEVHGVNLA